MTDPSQIGGDNARLDPEDPAGKSSGHGQTNLHIPVHRPVIVDISSKDVIHSFKCRCCG